MGEAKRCARARQERAAVGEPTTARTPFGVERHGRAAGSPSAFLALAHRMAAEEAAGGRPIAAVPWAGCSACCYTQVGRVSISARQDAPFTNTGSRPAAPAIVGSSAWPRSRAFRRLADKSNRDGFSHRRRPKIWRSLRLPSRAPLNLQPRREGRRGGLRTLCGRPFYSRCRDCRNRRQKSPPYGRCRQQRVGSWRSRSLALYKGAQSDRRTFGRGVGSAATAARRGEAVG